MASSNSGNCNSSSKNSKFNSILNSRSKNSSNILQVKDKPTYSQLISENAKTNKKWYDVKIKNSKNISIAHKKPRSRIPIKCKIQCPQTSCCIRITNLSRRITVDFLYENFSEFGTIKKLDLHFNQYDRFSKGFSYIMFSSPEESKNAVRTMDECEIDGYVITCKQWFLPYTEYCVSSILRGACSADEIQRYSPTHLSPTYYIIQHSSQLDRLNSHTGSRFHSLMYYDNIPPNKSLTGSSRISSSRSPRQSRSRSRSNSLTIHHSKSKKKTHNRSCNIKTYSKSSHHRSSRKPYKFY
ncbi:PREDICTED: RNA-binding protein with serine-rich domain 1-B-like [Diuraphis noxia]|uniref:RNA-binding protein with serine-rich domain 1-B-like n=1 Tax=Diuraphis noxia TaxID=143948 RepID=UPI0007638B53|nr:PREDICTED: RNA-binding protein with serine-rich domain 1-B-like [Diuraphis noxia]